MGLRVDNYNKRQDQYEVYAYVDSLERKDDGELVTVQMDTECFLCDANGKIEKHEIWSEIFDEYRECPIKEKEKKMYPEVYANIEKQLADAIREYNLDTDETNFDEPWKVLALKVKEQL